MPEKGFKVRRHLESRKYFHIFPPKPAFQVWLKWSHSSWSWGPRPRSVSLGKSEKFLLHRNLPINQESYLPCWLPRGHSEAETGWACPVLPSVRAFLADLCGCPRARLLLSTISHHSDPGHLNRPEASPRLRKEAGRRQITAMTFMMCFMVSKSLWFLQQFFL